MAVILTMAIITCFLQNDFAIMTLMVLLAGHGVIGVQRFFPLLIGITLGGALSLVIASVSFSRKMYLQLALIYLFLVLLGTIAWYPILFMRKFILYIGMYFGENISKYSWIWIPFMLLIYIIIPTILLAISVAGSTVFVIIMTPICLVAIATFLVNIMQRKCQSVLPKRLATWRLYTPYMHRLKPYDDIIKHATDSCKTAKDRVKKKFKRKRKGNAKEFWEKSRVHLYEWTVPKSPTSSVNTSYSSLPRRSLAPLAVIAKSSTSSENTSRNSWPRRGLAPLAVEERF